MGILRHISHFFLSEKLTTQVEERKGVAQNLWETSGEWYQSIIRVLKFV